MRIGVVNLGKERLEGIREDVGTNAKKEHEFITEILFDDALWLIEQAKRAQELERSNKMLNGNFKTIKHQCDLQEKINRDLVEQNKRYREELQSILDYDHIEKNIPQEVIDSINKALESESK